jgi:hypothetical protein
VTAIYNDLLLSRYERHRIFLAGALAGEGNPDWPGLIPSAGLLYRLRTDHHLVILAEKAFRRCRVDIRSCYRAWSVRELLDDLQRGSPRALLLLDAYSAGSHWLGMDGFFAEMSHLLVAYIRGSPEIWSPHAGIADAVLSGAPPLPGDPMAMVWAAISTTGLRKSEGVLHRV